MEFKDRIRSRVQIRNRSISQSVLMQRVFSVVMIALVLATIFTTLLYIAISRSTFANIKVKELLPKARALGALFADSESAGESVPESLLDAIAQNDAIIGAYFVVVDTEGDVIAHSLEVGADEITGLSEMTEAVLSGEEATAIFDTSITRLSMVGVGTPLVREGKVAGAILLFVPLVEVIMAMSSLNSALMLSLLIVMPIVVALTYIFVGRVVKPLRQMRDVALSMAGGDFEARADDTQRGEVGQLAQSLNRLSRELSRYISELTLERNRLKQSVDGLREGFIAVDSLANVTHANPAVRQLFEPFAKPGAEGRLALVPIEAVWDDFDRAVVKNEPRARQETVGDRVIMITISPLCEEGGSCVGAVGLFSDITERERLERTRRDFVANVSHELRTPLTAMRALVEPMRDGMVRTDEARQRYYEIILRETMRLSRLIDDLMELSRLQSGTQSIAQEAICLEPLISDVAEKYGAAANEQGREFELLFDAACPGALTNADRLEQVLVILLDNAIKYTPEGGTIRLSADWDEEKVYLRVADTGVGIAPQDMQYVFDRFYKVDRSHSGRGSGLGLSIAREVLARMDGEIGVTSELGKGSIFTVALKRAEPANKSARQIVE